MTHNNTDSDPPASSRNDLPEDHVVPPGPEEATAVIRGVIRDHRHLFRAFPDWGDDDLENECRAAVARSWHRYDGVHAQSTFVTTVAKRRLLSLARDLNRRRRRDQAAISMAKAKPVCRGDEDVAEWLEETYHAIRRRLTSYGIPLRTRRARRDYPDNAQVAALLALQRKLGLTLRQMSDMLRSRPLLLEVVGMAHPPSKSVFSRIYRRVSLLRFSFGN